MLLDTNILIAYLKNELPVVRTMQNWKKEGRSLFLCAIVATALDLEVPLVTRDRQLAKVPGLTIVTI